MSLFYFMTFWRGFNLFPGKPKMNLILHVQVVVVTCSTDDAFQNSISELVLYSPKATILYIKYTGKLMEKNSPQAVGSGAQIHKRLHFTPQTLSLQTKGLALLFQNLNFFQTHSNTEASKSKVVTF